MKLYSIQYNTVCDYLEFKSVKCKANNYNLAILITLFYRSYFLETRDNYSLLNEVGCFHFINIRQQTHDINLRYLVVDSTNHDYCNLFIKRSKIKKSTNIGRDKHLNTDTQGFIIVGIPILL